ncbi:MAG: hypothetical protein HY344_02385 [Candidatus Levybacteria bacterium]|nr:hypothetical protein [Candidatus Levybacteria bacterium]
MNSEILIALVGSLGLGGLIGAYLNDRFERNRERELYARERKEDQYKKFLENIIGFFEGWIDKERQKNFMEELYTHAPLYASATVIRLANKFIAAHSSKKPAGGDSDDFYKKLVVAIQKDMKGQTIWHRLKFWEKDNLSEEDISIFKLDK